MYPYNETCKSMVDDPIIKAITRYTFIDGINYISVLNEALWISTLQHCLLNPNQLRANGVLVQDNPYHTESMTITSNDGQVRHV